MVEWTRCWSRKVSRVPCRATTDEFHPSSSSVVCRSGNSLRSLTVSGSPQDFVRFWRAQAGLRSSMIGPDFVVTGTTDISDITATT